MSAAAELHNRLAGEIVKSIIKPVVETGGSVEDIMVLTESVLLGVTLTCVKLGGDKHVLDLIVGRVKDRLAEVRLAGIKMEGRG